MLTLLSLGAGILSGLAGVVLLMPSLMAWDSGNPPLDLKILSYSGLAVIPTAVLSTLFIIVTQNKIGFFFYLIPYIGILGTLGFSLIKQKLFNNNTI
jgi:hypothetical protein